MKRIIFTLTALLLSWLTVLQAADSGVAVPLVYAAPADGYLSLALFSDRGQLVCGPLHAKPVKAGGGTVMWDGTSDLGIPSSSPTPGAR
jgi:hypothetical protein